MSKKEASNGISFTGLLTVLFIGLKLTGCITWSWLWVLAPLWIPFAIALVIIFGVILAFGIALIIMCIMDKVAK